MRNSLSFSGTLSVMSLALLLSACGGSSTTEPMPAPAPVVVPAPTTATYELTLVNMTAGQPFSPMLAVAHNDAFSVFNLGDVASVGLERIAEGGDASVLLAMANDSKSVAAAAVASSGLPPSAGGKVTVTLTVPLTALPTLRLSVAAMLGNTNDGFTGVNGQSISALAVGASMDVRMLGYDAGTERNTETADTVPGPATADSGGKRESFNPMRDDVINTVHIHPGVVSKDDGLPTSALTLMQRWDNPVALLSIKRTR